MANNFFNKSDLKHLNKINVNEETVFVNDEIKNLYERFKHLTSLEYRLYESQREEYEYLDLSNMNLTNEDLNEILQNHNNIFKKIPFLDVSNNHLTKLPNLNDYSNIVILCASDNKLETITSNYLVELNCCNNNITFINGPNLVDINASNNKIDSIVCPNVQKLSIHNNPIQTIPFFRNLHFLECSINRLDKKYEILNVYKERNKYQIEMKN